MRVEVLALDDVFDTGLAAVLDAFGTANELAGTSPAPFDVAITGVRRKVKTSRGLTVPVSLADSNTRPDCVVIPAMACKMPARSRWAWREPMSATRSK